MMPPLTPMSGGSTKLRPRSGRTPLQPKNSDITHSSPKPKPNPMELSMTICCEKENRPIPIVPDGASSLATELEAIKKRIERLRVDKEKTEKMLKERETILDAKMNELEERGEIQKVMEIQVDRLFRLKELKSRCMRVSPITTLRKKEQQKILTQSPSPSKVKTEETVVALASESESECREECEIHSPGSACSKTDDTHKY